MPLNITLGYGFPFILFTLSKLKKKKQPQKAANPPDNWKDWLNYCGLYKPMLSIYLKTLSPCCCSSFCIWFSVCRDVRISKFEYSRIICSRNKFLSHRIRCTALRHSCCRFPALSAAALCALRPCCWFWLILGICPFNS